MFEMKWYCAIIWELDMFSILPSHWLGFEMIWWKYWHMDLKCFRWIMWVGCPLVMRWYDSYLWDVVPLWYYDDDIDDSVAMKGVYKGTDCSDTLLQEVSANIIYSKGYRCGRLNPRRGRTCVTPPSSTERGPIHVDELAPMNSWPTSG